MNLTRMFAIFESVGILYSRVGISPSTMSSTDDCYSLNGPSWMFVVCQFCEINSTFGASFALLASFDKFRGLTFRDGICAEFDGHQRIASCQLSMARIDHV